MLGNVVKIITGLTREIVITKVSQIQIQLAHFENLEFLEVDS